jgi:hypothetical protein
MEGKEKKLKIITEGKDKKWLKVTLAEVEKSFKLCCLSEREDKEVSIRAVSHKKMYLMIVYPEPGCRIEGVRCKEDVGESSIGRAESEYALLFMRRAIVAVCFSKKLEFTMEFGGPKTILEKVRDKK